MARRYLDVYGDLLARRPFGKVVNDDLTMVLGEPRSFAAIA